MVLSISIFIIPILSSDFQRSLFGLSFTVILILCAFSVVYYQQRIAVFALAVIAAEWISRTLNMPILYSIALPLKFIFFLLIVAVLMVQIIRSKKVNGLVLLQAINVYLLLGLCFALLVALLEAVVPNSFSFLEEGEAGRSIAYGSKFIYFTFITFTSTGFGDFLPLTPTARSLSILISITGQLYIAIIIAIIVGKYSSSK